MNDLYAGDQKNGNISLKYYIDNYVKIINSSPDVKFVVVGITPARGKVDKVRVWNSALQDLCYTTNSIFINTDYLSEDNLIDAIHPNQEAHNREISIFCW
jgi:hypothetical protein